jgi:hypothetical protein
MFADIRSGEKSKKSSFLKKKGVKNIKNYVTIISAKTPLTTGIKLKIS